MQRGEAEDKSMYVASTLSRPGKSPWLMWDLDNTPLTDLVCPQHPLPHPVKGLVGPGTRSSAF
jgi:hypothetical protein